MKTLLNISVAAILLVSCAKSSQEIENSSHDQPELNNRTILAMFANQSSLFTSNYAVKKYESGKESTPSTVVSVRNGVMQSFAFNGAALNMTNGQGSTYFSPQYFSQVQNVNSLYYGQNSLQFQTVEPIRFNNFSSSNITSGDNVRWNSSNNTGVGEVLIVIRADYASMNVSPLPKYDAKLILSEDDGVYTITSQDLNDFPAGTPLVLDIVRGDYSETNVLSNILVGTASITHSKVLFKS